jgi:hypothetical protein
MERIFVHVVVPCNNSAGKSVYKEYLIKLEKEEGI